MSMETKRTVLHGPHDVPGSPVHAAEGYERRDADTSSLLKYGVALCVILIFVLFSMKWTFSYFAKSQTLGPPASPFENARVLPPEPRLEPQPRNNLHDYCTDQMHSLNSYGWLDQQNGVVRIPIDRAIEVTLEHGLPSRSVSDASRVAPPSPSEESFIGNNGPCAFWTTEDESGKKPNSERP
jgi:hypothetical protein